MRGGSEWRSTTRRTVIVMSDFYLTFFMHPNPSSPTPSYPPHWIGISTSYTRHTHLFILTSLRRASPWTSHPVPSSILTHLTSKISFEGHSPSSNPLPAPSQVWSHSCSRASNCSTPQHRTLGIRPTRGERKNQDFSDVGSSWRSRRVLARRPRQTASNAHSTADRPP